jgi:hypothetical protein
MKREGAQAATLGLALPASDAPARAWVWPLLVTLAVTATIAPFWTSQLLPYQDAPQHLAAIRILADYRTWPFAFDRWFVLDFHRLQYLGFYLPAAALAKLVGPEAACRLLLSIIALALVEAFRMLLGAFGRDQRLAVFAPLAIHTAPLYLGFFNFVESVPLAIAVVALVERELRQPRPARAWVLAIAAALCIWLHPSALAFALFAAVLLAATAGGPARRRLRALLPLLPAALLFAAWALQALLSRDGAGVEARAAPRWTPFPQHVLDLFRIGNVLAGHGDEICFFGTLLLFVLAILVPGRPSGRRVFRLPLLAAATLAVYLAAPFDIGYMGYVALRALPFLLLLVLASPLIAPGRWTSALCAGAVALQVAYAVVLVRAGRAFDAEAQFDELRAVLDKAPAGGRLLAIVLQQDSRVVQFQAYVHFAGYAELWRGGRARYGFPETPWSPIRYRPSALPLPLPRGWEMRPASIDPAALASDTDVLLVRGPAEPPPAPYVLTAAAGRWSLYSVRR